MVAQLDALHALPDNCWFVNYLRCHDDIGWGLDEAVENRIKAILTELLAVRRSRKLNELTLSDINHAIRSGYSGATNAAVSEPEADVKLGKDKVIILGDVSVTIERE